MNAHIMPTQCIVVKEEPIEIKQEVVCETIIPEISNASSYVTENLVRNEPQSKIDALIAEKSKLIADYLSVKSDNQRIYYELQKKDEIILQHDNTQKELNTLVSALKNKVEELKIKDKQNVSAEKDLSEQLARTKEQLSAQSKESDETKKKIDSLLKKNKVLQARINQIQTGINPNRPDREENLFDVDYIVDHKIKYKKRYFLIRWEGFGKETDSWEPEKNVKHLQIYRDYLKKKNI